MAARVKVSHKTIRNEMTSGIFRKDLHDFNPRGLRPRFKWAAVQAWLEGKDDSARQDEEDLIPDLAFTLKAT